jgi:antitoxin CcdA
MFDMAQKRKVSVTLDEELVSALEDGDETLSAQVNMAVRLEVERRARGQLLGRWLDELEQIDGAVDEALVSAFEEMLT